MKFFFRWSRRTNRKYSPKQGHVRPKRLSIESLETRALVTADLLTGVPLAMAATADTSQVATPAATTAPVAKLYLTITDANDQPITGPLAVGQTFFVDFSVQDLRTSLSDAGIEEAGTSIIYDPDVVTPTGTVTAGPNYPVGLTKDLSTAGAVGVNATEQFNAANNPPFPPLGSGVELVARRNLRLRARAQLCSQRTCRRWLRAKPRTKASSLSTRPEPQTTVAASRGH